MSRVRKFSFSYRVCVILFRLSCLPRLVYSFKYFRCSSGEQRIKCNSTAPAIICSNKQPLEDSSSDDSDTNTTSSTKGGLNKKARRDFVIYWMCYDEGLQKVLLFTHEHKVIVQMTKSMFLETCDYEFLLSLSGIGVSVFTHQNTSKEHAYFSVADVPATWEVNVGHKWKTLTLELASWIEDKYRLHCKKCHLKDYIHIDFEKMFMMKPFFAELKRSYNPAIYVMYRKSKQYQYLDVRVQSIQVDNKQTESNDSVVFHTIPSGNIKTTTPFIEAKILRNDYKNCNIYKQVQLNIEQFYLHMQFDFVMQLISLVTDSLKLSSDLLGSYRSEMATIHAPITTLKEVPIT